MVHIYANSKTEMSWKRTILDIVDALFWANPDPTFHVDADPDPESDPEPNSSYSQVQKSEEKIYFYSQQCQFTVLDIVVKAIVYRYN